MCSNQKGRQLSAFLLLAPLRNVELPENVVLPGNVEPPGTVEHRLDDADEPVLSPPGYPETPHSPATPSPPGTSSPLGTSSTSSMVRMVRTTLPSQPLTSEQIQLPARTRPLPVLSPLHQPRRYRIEIGRAHV